MTRKCLVCGNYNIDVPELSFHRFVCTHLSKSRNISGTCKKISQSTRYHFSNSKPSSSSATRELSEEPEDTINNETPAENSNRPVTCPGKLQHVPVCTKTFGLGNVKNTSKTSKIYLAEHPKLYTNNFLTVDPPVPSISKKYFHIYSISKDRIPIDDSAIPVKRIYSGFSSRNLGTDELDNYKMALQDLQRIKSQKLDSQWRPKTSSSYKSSSAHSSSMWLKTRKRHTSKTDISYPTHTINHNLKLNKRYKIREGAIDCQVEALEQALINSKKMEEQVQRVTQCLDVSYSKKGKTLTNKPKRESLINITIRKKKSTSSAEARKSQERTEVGPVAQPYIQYHPTIKNASKEVKMKLKRKYVQLLLKPSKQKVLQVSSNWNQPEVQDELEEEPYQNDNVKAVENNEEANVSELEIEAARPAKTAMAEIEDYVESARYPQRVYVDISTPYEIDKVCVTAKSDKHNSASTREEQKVSKSEIIDENPQASRPTGNQQGPKIQKAQINVVNMEKDLDNTNKFIKELTDLEDRNLGSLAEQVRISRKIDQLMQHREKITQELRSLIAVPGKRNDEVTKEEIESPAKTEIEPLEYDEIENLNSEAAKKIQRAKRLRRIMEHHSIIEERNAKMEQQKPKINTRKSAIMKNIGELLEKNKRRDQVKQELEDLELGITKPLSRSEEDKMIQQHPRIKNIQAKPDAAETTEASCHLEEPDEVEELNEQASAKVRMAHHQNMLRKQQMQIDQLKEQMAAVVATPTVKIQSPKGDKKIAILAEKNNRAERVKEKIETFNDNTTGREKRHVTRANQPRQEVKPMKEDSRVESTVERSDEITTDTEIHKKSLPSSKLEDTVKKILNAVLLNQVITPVKTELQQEDVKKESEEKLCSMRNENMKSKHKKNDKIKCIEEPTKNKTQDSQNGTHNSPQKQAITPEQQKEPVCSIPTLKEKDPTEDDEDLDVVLVRDRKNMNKEVTAKEKPTQVPALDLKDKTSTTIQCNYQELLSELGIKNKKGIVPVDVPKQLEPIQIKTKKEIQPVCETKGIMNNDCQQDYKSDMNENKTSVIHLKSPKETGMVKEENLKDLIIQPNLEAKAITKIDPKDADLSVNIIDAIKTVMHDDTLHAVEKPKETPLKVYVETINAIEKTTEKPLACRVDIASSNSICPGKSVSEKTTEKPLVCPVDMPSSSLISPGKNVPEILTISNINDTVMKDYFMEKILPGTFETIYLPKSEVVVNFKNNPIEAKTYIGHGQSTSAVMDYKGSSTKNESQNEEDPAKIKKKVIKLKDGISELYTRVKRKSSREMTMKQFEKSAGDSEQKADKAKDNENAKVNEGIHIKNKEKSCENKTQTEVVDTKPSRTSSKQSYSKNGVSRLGNKIRVPPPVRPPSGKEKERRKKDKPKGKKDMVLPPKRKGADIGAVLYGKSYQPESPKKTEKIPAENISGLEGNKLIKSINDLQQTKGTFEVQRDSTVGQTSKTEPQKKDSSKSVLATAEKIDKMEEKIPLKSLDDYKYEEEKSETQREVVLPNKISPNSVAAQASQQIHDAKSNVTNTGRILQENKPSKYPVSGEYKHETDKFKEQKSIATLLSASEKTSHQGYSAKSSGTDTKMAPNLGENKSTKSLGIVPPLGASEKTFHQGYGAKSSGTDTKMAPNLGENKSTKSLGIVPPVGAPEKTSHQGYNAKSSGTDTKMAPNLGENKSTKSLGIVPPLGASEKTSHQGYSAKLSGTDAERASNLGENKSTKSLGTVPPVGAPEKTSHQGYSAKLSGTDAERAPNLGENKSTKSLGTAPPLGASEKSSHQGYSAKSSGTDTKMAPNLGENKSTKSLGIVPPLGASEKTSHQGYNAKSSGTDTKMAPNLGENKSTKYLGIVPPLGASEKTSHQGYSAKLSGTDTERAPNLGENKSTKSLGIVPPLGVSEKTSHQGYSAKLSGTDAERASNLGENKSTKSLGIVPSLASEKTSHQGYSAKLSGTDTERALNLGENKSTKSLGIVPPLGASEKTSYQGYSAKLRSTDTEKASNLGENKSMKPLDAYKNKSAQSKEQNHKALSAKSRASNSIIFSEKIITQREKHTQSTTNNTEKAPKQPEKKPTNSLDESKQKMNEPIEKKVHNLSAEMKSSIPSEKVRQQNNTNTVTSFYNRIKMLMDTKQEKSQDITSKNDAKTLSPDNTSSISVHPNKETLKTGEKTDVNYLSEKISWSKHALQNEIINTELLNMEIRKRQPLKEFKIPDITEEIVPQVNDKRFESKKFWIQDQKLDKQALNKEIQDRYAMKQFRNLAIVPNTAKYCAPQHCINKKALELEIFERQSRKVQSIFPSPLAKYCAPQHCINKKALEVEIFERQSRRVQGTFPSPLAKYCAPQHCINKKALEVEIFERQSRRVQKKISTMETNSSNKLINIEISANTALRDTRPKMPNIKRSHSARNSAETKINLPRKRWENNAYSEIWSTSHKANDSAPEEKANKMVSQNKNGSFKVLSLNKLDQDKEEALKKTPRPSKDLKNSYNANEPRDVNKTKENNFHTMHNANNRKQSIKDKLGSGKTIQQTERDDKQSVRPASCPPLKSGVVNYSSGTKNTYKQGKLQMGSKGTLNYISGSAPPGNNKPPGPIKKEPLKDKDDAVCNKNLKQDHPMLVLNVTLPKIEISTASGNSKETKVISSCSGEFKLWGKLENETVKPPQESNPIKEKKLPQKPRADTSTISLGTLGDRHFHKRSSPNLSPEKSEPANSKTIEESPRKAVFQILPESESVVIRKAEIDEKKPKKETSPKSDKKYFYTKQDSEPAEMQTKSPPGATSRAQLSLKNFADPAEDTELSYVSRQRALYEMPARLRAEIVMIYDKDSSQKIRHDQKYRRFNRKLVANDEARSFKPRPIFCDLNGRNFIKIKKQFFENGLKPELQKPRKNISTNSSSTDKKVVNNFSNTPGTQKDEPKKPVEEIGDLLIKEVQKVFQKPDNEKGLTQESKTGKSITTNTDKVHAKKADIVQPKNKGNLSKKPSPKESNTVNTSELSKGKATSEDISNIQHKSNYKIQLKCSKKDDLNLTKADGSFKTHNKEVATKKKGDSKENTKKKIVAWPPDKQSKNYEIQMKCTKLEKFQEDTPNEKIKEEKKSLKPTLEAKNDAKPKSETTKSSARSQIKKVQVVEKLDKPEEDQSNKKLTANSDKESPRSEILEKNIKNVEENLIKFGFFKPKTESNVNDVPQKDGEPSKETAPAETTEKPKIDQQESAVLKSSEVEKHQTMSKEVSSSEIKKESTALKSSEVEKQQAMNKEISSSEINKESTALKSSEAEKQQPTNNEASSCDFKKESIVLKLNYIENQKTKYNLAAANNVKARDPLKQALEDMKTKSKKAVTSTLLKKKTKKDEVKEINSAAEYLLEQEKKKRYEEMLKGKKKQKKYEQDAKIVAPSIGNSDWGVEIKSRTSTEETKNDSFDDKLMSKSEYLRWKEQKEADESLKVDQAVLNHKIKKIANLMADTVKQEEERQLKHDYDISMKYSKTTDYSLDDQNLLEVEHKTRAQRLEESIREKNANKIRRNLGNKKDDDHRKGHNLALTKKLDVAKTSKNLNDTKPPHCAKIVLPLRKLPEQTFEQSLEEYSSIIKKPVGDEIKTVPKDFSSGKNKKSNNNALAKYSHLKISFMTVKRPRPVNKDEKFLPAVVKKKRYVPRGVSKEERNKIIQMRYQMLKQLQENFNKDNAANMPPDPVHKTEVVIPYKFDTVNVKQPDKEKKETETIQNPKVKNMKGVISYVKPKNVANLPQLTRSVSGSDKKTGDKDSKIKKKNKDGLLGDGKGGDMGKTKKYSTMAEKSDCCDENGCEGSSTTKNECEKTPSDEAKKECQSQSPSCEDSSTTRNECEKTSSGETKEECQSQSKAECPESQGFDAMEAVPQAFQCPSQELEEERQKNLYYRYHQYSFNDLHSYLHDQRAFVKEKKEKEIGEKDSKTAKD